MKSIVTIILVIASLSILFLSNYYNKKIDEKHLNIDEIIKKINSMLE